MMPDPREAIYDVLKAKWQRQKDAEAAAARARETGNSLEQWNANNQRARSATQSLLRSRKQG